MTTKQISGAVMAIAGIVAGELCALKVWYLPQPDGNVEVSCLIGIAVAIVLVIGGADMLHDPEPRRRWPPSLT